MDLYDPANVGLIEKVESFVPTKYRSVLTIVVLASPYVTRAVLALVHGRGIKGVLSAIWLGTNTPKPPSGGAKTDNNSNDPTTPT